jgi:hypothetical protein
MGGLSEPQFSLDIREYYIYIWFSFKVRFDWVGLHLIGSPDTHTPFQIHSHPSNGKQKKMINSIKTFAFCFRTFSPQSFGFHPFPAAATLFQKQPFFRSASLKSGFWKVWGKLSYRSAGENLSFLLEFLWDLERESGVFFPV